MKRANEESRTLIQTFSYSAQFGRLDLEVARTIALVLQEIEPQDSGLRAEQCSTNLKLIALLSSVSPVLKPTTFTKRQDVVHDRFVRLGKNSFI